MLNGLLYQGNRQPCLKMPAMPFFTMKTSACFYVWTLAKEDQNGERSERIKENEWRRALEELRERH